jgi:3-oxoacyl-[acyl-carrier protein] reductase
MDLGIKGKKAIVCAASMGLGRACARALAREGARVVVNARRLEPLAETAEGIKRDFGAQVSLVMGDVTTSEGRAALVGACPDPDILVTNSGGPPAGDFREWGEAEWHAALQNNMVAHIILIREVIDAMIERGWGRIVNITSAAVKMPYPNLGLSNGARAGLTGFIAGLARQTSRHGVTINNLLPGSHVTDRMRKLLEADARGRNLPYAAIEAEARAGEVSGRFGNPEDFGDICAFLCSNQANYVTGQNVVVDGGTYPGTL